MVGFLASSPAPSTNTGFLYAPEEYIGRASTRHNWNRPARFDAKTTSRPSGVQAKPRIPFRSLVSLRTSPPFAGVRKRSHPSRMALRQNASVRPSGDIAMAMSPALGSYGDVRRCSCPVASETRKTLCAKGITFLRTRTADPSGVHATRPEDSATFRSGPPRGDTRKTSPLRTNAIWLPSGDHAGHESNAESLVT